MWGLTPYIHTYIRLRTERKWNLNTDKEDSHVHCIDLPNPPPRPLLSAQVLLMIDIELSYMNTNHEDFIGFAKWVIAPSLCAESINHRQMKNVIVYMWPLGPWKLMYLMYVSLCVCVCAALSRGSTKWTRKKQPATRYFNHNQAVQTVLVRSCVSFSSRFL